MGAAVNGIDNASPSSIISSIRLNIFGRFVWLLGNDYNGKLILAKPLKAVALVIADSATECCQRIDINHNKADFWRKNQNFRLKIG